MTKNQCKSAMVPGEKTLLDVTLKGYKDRYGRHPGG